MSFRRICDGCNAELSKESAPIDGSIVIDGTQILEFDACSKSCVRRILIQFCNSYQTGKTETQAL